MIAIVGATGTLGGETARLLLAAGHAVAAVTRDARRGAALALLGQAVLAGRRAAVFGRGENPTNFVAARDVARLAARALTDPALAGETIEVGAPALGAPAAPVG